MKRSIFCAAAMSGLLAFGSAANADVLVAVGGPITGPLAAFGAQLQMGVEQAAADQTPARASRGMQIKILVGDDSGEPKQGVSVANKFVADGANRSRRLKYEVSHYPIYGCLRSR